MNIRNPFRRNAFKKCAECDFYCTAPTGKEFPFELNEFGCELEPLRRTGIDLSGWAWSSSGRATDGSRTFAIHRFYSAMERATVNNNGVFFEYVGYEGGDPIYRVADRQHPEPIGELVRYSTSPDTDAVTVDFGDD